MTRVIQPFAVRRDPLNNMISFRRNDRDRAPARIVRMPNDGPAPDRLLRAEAIRRSLAKPNEAGAPTRFGERRMKLLAALGRGACSMDLLVDRTGIARDSLNDLISKASIAGLLEKDRAAGIVTITEDGRAYLPETIQ